MSEYKQQTGTSAKITVDLLHWSVLIPNAGIEYCFAENWSVGIKGMYTWWSFDKGNKGFYLWDISPEVKYYFRKDRDFRGGYLGFYGGGGQYDIKLFRHKKGVQGDYYGVGLTGGYVMRLNRNFDMGFYLGMGFVHTSYDKYISKLPCYKYAGSGVKNYFGPTKAGIALFWRLDNKKKRGREL